MLESKIIRYTLYSINFVLYTTLVITWITLPEVKWLNWGNIILSVSLTLILVYPQRKAFYIYYHSSHCKNLFSTILTSLLIFCILAISGYLVFKHNYQLDLTKNKINTLSAQTIVVLKKLEHPLKFKLFSRKADHHIVLPLLELYRLYKSDLSIELIDPDVRPDLVREHMIEKYQTVVVEYNERKIYVLESNEAAITKGLLKASVKKKYNIFFTVGHKEDSTLNNKADGLSYFKNLVENAYYNIFEINLAKLKNIPKNVDLLMIWGPREPFFDSEINKVKEYLDRGGALILAINPDLQKFKLVKLAGIIKDWGIEYHNALAIDTKSFVDGSKYTIPLINSYHKSHVITKFFRGQTFFPLATSLKIIKEKEKNYKITPLIQTNQTPYAWGENDLKQILKMKVKYDEGIDIKGPINLVVASEKGNKVLALANSTFVTNAYKNYGANFNFLLNAISWSVDEEFVIANDRPLIRSEPIFLSSIELGIIFYFSIIIAPIILNLAAIYFYRRRQRL